MERDARIELASYAWKAQDRPLAQSRSIISKLLNNSGDWVSGEEGLLVPPALHRGQRAESGRGGHRIPEAIGFSPKTSG